MNSRGLGSASLASCQHAPHTYTMARRKRRTLQLDPFPGPENFDAPLALAPLALAPEHPQQEAGKWVTVERRHAPKLYDWDDLDSLTDWIAYAEALSAVTARPAATAQPAATARPQTIPTTIPPERSPPPPRAQDIQLAVVREVWDHDGCNNHETRQRIAERLKITDEDAIYSLGEMLARQIRVRTGFQRMIDQPGGGKKTTERISSLLANHVGKTDENKRENIARFTKAVSQNAGVALAIGDLQYMVKIPKW